MSEIGNPLEMTSNEDDFESFRSTLESELLNIEKKNNAGAKPYDVVFCYFFSTDLNVFDFVSDKIKKMNF